MLAQAPTGIGKTVGTLFPALKAMATTQLDKVFYLVAKTSGRKLALDVLRRFQSQSAGPMPLRVVELTARGKLCEYPGMPLVGIVFLHQIVDFYVGRTKDQHDARDHGNAQSGLAQRPCGWAEWRRCRS